MKPKSPAGYAAFFSPARTQVSTIPLRSYAAEHPDAKPADIADALTKQTGVTFTNGQVSTTLYQAKKREGGGKQASKPRAKGKSKAAPVSAPAADGGLEQAADFAEKVGGLDRAEALLAKLRQIKERL